MPQVFNASESSSSRSTGTGSRNASNPNVLKRFQARSLYLLVRHPLIICAVGMSSMPQAEIGMSYSLNCLCMVS
jgi:hypothetical protein